MAYQTGIINSTANLATLISSFAESNGWTVNGNIINKNGCFVEVIAADSNMVTIRGAKSGVFSGVNLCPRSARIRFNPWPSSVTYHIISFDDPDTIWCTINFGTIYFMHIGFGNIRKYSSWNGGMWFHAHHTTGNEGHDCLAVVDGAGRPYISATPNNCALFWNQMDYSQWGNASNNKCSFLHCELRGEIWPATGSTSDTSNLNQIHCPFVLRPIQKANPNAFNNQTVLTPFQLFLSDTDGHMMPIGHVGHLRFVKMNNYNPGDVIEIGSDRWKLFPWHFLNPAQPNGKAPGWNDGSFSTGLLGVAVRYDGA